MKARRGFFVLMALCVLLLLFGLAACVMGIQAHRDGFSQPRESAIGLICRREARI